MPEGTIKDARMNHYEETGILVYFDKDEKKCKDITYIKDENSKHLTCNTPVNFDLEKGVIRGGKLKAQVDVAVNVEVNKRRIKRHPVINGLNQCAKELLAKYPDWPEGC